MLVFVQVFTSQARLNEEEASEGLEKEPVALQTHMPTPPEPIPETEGPFQPFYAHQTTEVG